MYIVRLLMCTVQVWITERVHVGTLVKYVHSYVGLVRGGGGGRRGVCKVRSREGTK